MKYLSTRGDATPRAFGEILLEGLAPDGGLYLPERYPPVDAPTLARWRTLAYPALAFEILSLYIDDIPAADLRALAERTYTRATYGSDAIVPVRRLEDGLYIEALTNGPTLAFKDIAMQLLGALFEYELARRGEELNILGATSGDTGSAAEYAMRGKRGLSVCPRRRSSYSNRLPSNCMAMSLKARVGPLDSSSRCRPGSRVVSGVMSSARFSPSRPGRHQR